MISMSFQEVNMFTWKDNSSMWIMETAARGGENTECRYVRFEVSTAVTMKNGVFWDIKPQFILHRRHITSPLESSQLMLWKI
jgi:hypothetical protein